MKGKPSKIKYEYSGQLMTLSELMVFSNVNRGRLRCRLNEGWDVELALTKPLDTKKQHCGEHSHAPSKATVDVNIAKRAKKNKGFKLFAQCSARCNAK